MFRTRLSLASCAAALALAFGTTDAQAGHCDNHHSYKHHKHQNCCQSGYYSHNGGYSHNGYYTYNNGYYSYNNRNCQQAVSYNCQPVRYVTTQTCYTPQTTCCVQSAAGVVPTSQAPAIAPAPQPPVDQAPAPAPGT